MPNEHLRTGVKKGSGPNACAMCRFALVAFGPEPIVETVGIEPTSADA